MEENNEVKATRTLVREIIPLLIIYIALFLLIYLGDYFFPNKNLADAFFNGVSFCVKVVLLSGISMYFLIMLMSIVLPKFIKRAFRIEVKPKENKIIFYKK